MVTKKLYNHNKVDTGFMIGISIIISFFIIFIGMVLEILGVIK